MNEFITAILSDPSSLMRWGVIGVVALAFVLVVNGFLSTGETSAVVDRPNWVKVDHAVSGHSIALESDERLNYAGIRAPYPNEPFFEEARARNMELVNKKKVRVRFDTSPRDRKGRWFGYVSLEDGMVNEILVREGLAYARLTTGTRRFADRLLDAQREARKKKRGLWKKVSRSNESSYPADPKYGNFHRPSCPEVAKMNKQRAVTLSKKKEAFDAGFAPCAKCLP